MPENFAIVIRNDLLIIDVIIDRKDQTGKDEKICEICARTEPLAHMRDMMGAYARGRQRTSRICGKEDALMRELPRKLYAETVSLAHMCGLGRAYAREAELLSVETSRSRAYVPMKVTHMRETCRIKNKPSVLAMHLDVYTSSILHSSAFTAASTERKASEIPSSFILY